MAVVMEAEGARASAAVVLTQFTREEISAALIVTDELLLTQGTIVA